MFLWFPWYLGRFACDVFHYPRHKWPTLLYFQTGEKNRQLNGGFDSEKRYGCGKSSKSRNPIQHHLTVRYECLSMQSTFLLGVPQGLLWELRGNKLLLLERSCPSVASGTCDQRDNLCFLQRSRVVPSRTFGGKLPHSFLPRSPTFNALISTLYLNYSQRFIPHIKNVVMFKKSCKINSLYQKHQELHWKASTVR